MTDAELQTLLNTAAPADAGAMDRAARRQAQLAKPPGSLGKLEDMSIRLAGITGQVCNTLDSCRVLVFAADNGVVAEGVASTPQSVTLSQSINMTRHLTGMSALARYFGNSVVVVDVGIDAELHHPQILDRKIRRGTRNLAKEPALTREETLAAIAVGLETAGQAKAEGVQALGIGEMGIGNTTTSSAVLAALTKSPAEAVTGRGSGLTDDAFALKKRVIRDALALHRPNPADPVDVLSKVGGLDVAAMTGAFLGCAIHRIPAVVDGFISIVAALAAVRLCPVVRDFLFLSHASYEVGYRIAQEELGLEPFLLLGMRLGEGSGCPLAFQILKGACAAMSGMATFAEAAIDDGYLAQLRVGDAFTVS
ncbi:MAG: nicotinate-nucleotide--dimethylbenzimidazole phosphoribosyltransferase [Clostridiales bacterium]|nr:nicotinate-nucleotide--dimethylbenzimidazole phosphoribosyltransferase [Clostridiales bacterium]